MFKLKYSFFLLAALCFFATFGCVGCKSDPPANKPPVTTVPAPVKKAVKVPRFNRDRAYDYVAKQCSFGPRVPNTPEHKACRDWMIEEMKTLADDVVVQDFDAKAYDGKILKATNVIGVFNPEEKKRVLLFAHWDSRHISDADPSAENYDKPVMGADDGASGVGVLFEIAKTIKENPIELGVDILLLDVEDYGNPAEGDHTYTWGLGSQYWSKNMHTSNYNAKYGILLDMVGTKGARFPKEEVSVKYAPKILNKVWKLAQEMGYGNHFVNDRSGGVTDDHFFVNTIAKIPSIDIINKPKGPRSFGPHWHTQGDNLDVINKSTLRAVGQVVLAVIYNESGNQF